MFYKGVLRSYDPENQVGVIYLSELDSEYNFKLSDLPNPSIQPTIDERLKCFVKEVKGHKTIKFIVRLDNNNAPDASYEQLNQVKNEEIENFDKVSSVMEEVHKTEKVDLVTQEQASLVHSESKSAKEVAKTHSVAVLDSNIHNTSFVFTEEKPVQQVQNNEIQSQFLDQKKDESERISQKIENVEIKNKDVEEEYWEDDREFFENKKDLSKLKKISIFQKIKNALTYKKRKPKKEKKKVEVYLNPWVILMIIVVPIAIEVGDRGYKKYNLYQKGQQEKARLYEIEQKRIVEEQRKKLGKLPNKVLSDETLDELLGKDRSE